MRQRYRDSGIDLAGLRFEHPVAAQVGRAGLVDGSRDVGAGHLADGLDEALAGAALADVAAVQQDVAVGAQCLADACEIHLVLLRQAVRRIGLAGEDQVAGAAVADDVDRVDIAPAIHVVGHLVERIAARIEHHHRCVGIHPGEQRLVALDGRVDEHDLVAHRRRFGRETEPLGGLFDRALLGRGGRGRRAGLRLRCRRRRGLGRRAGVALQGGGRLGAEIDSERAVEQHARLERQHARATRGALFRCGGAGLAPHGLFRFAVGFLGHGLSFLLRCRLHGSAPKECGTRSSRR